MKKSDDQQKWTVMSYLNHLKTKLEKQEENNNAAMMGDDQYIREVDEYSEETHSDDLFQKAGHKDHHDRHKGGGLIPMATSQLKSSN